MPQSRTRTQAFISHLKRELKRIHDGDRDVRSTVLDSPQPSPRWVAIEWLLKSNVVECESDYLFVGDAGETRCVVRVAESGAVRVPKSVSGTLASFYALREFREWIPPWFVTATDPPVHADGVEIDYLPSLLSPGRRWRKGISALAAGDNHWFRQLVDGRFIEPGQRVPKARWLNGHHDLGDLGDEPVPIKGWASYRVSVECASPAEVVPVQSAAERQSNAKDGRGVDESQNDSVTESPPADLRAKMKQRIADDTEVKEVVSRLKDPETWGTSVTAVLKQYASEKEGRDWKRIRGRVYHVKPLWDSAHLGGAKE